MSDRTDEYMSAQMDALGIMRQVMERFDHGRAFYARTIAKDTGLSIDEVEGALSRLCAQGLVDAHNEAEDPVYFAAGKTVVVNNAPAALVPDYGSGYKRGADDERAMVCNWLLATGNASAQTVASIRAGMHWQAHPEMSDLKLSAFRSPTLSRRLPT